MFHQKILHWCCSSFHNCCFLVREEVCIVVAHNSALSVVMTLACRESRVHAVQPFHTMHFGAKYRHLHTRLAALRARRSERRS